MGPQKARERVLVIPEDRLRAAGAFTGFRPYTAEFLSTLLDPDFQSYRPRGAVETDSSLKQLIPYVVLTCGNQVFHYRRGDSGAETRLRTLRSVGIGGHISQRDGASGSDAYRAGMLRELAEELEIDSPYDERCLGFIYDPSTPVGEVHLGIVHLFELEHPRARPREEAIAAAGFAPIDELLCEKREFETWSQFVLETLAAAPQ